MSSNHWFVEAMSELVEDAKKDNEPNVLNGLGAALEIFCLESKLNVEQMRQIQQLVSIDTRQGNEAYLDVADARIGRDRRMDA